MLKLSMRFISMVLIVGILNLVNAQAHAGMISTSQAISHVSASAQRERVVNFLKAPAIQKQLNDWGVPSDEALQRVAALSDQEISHLNGQLDQLPAGQDGLGGVVGAIVLIFLILLLTDLLGLTNVFPFVNKR